MGHDRSERVLQRRVTESGLAEGAVAQLGERLPCTQEVSGSIPLSSTKTAWKNPDYPDTVSVCRNKCFTLMKPFFLITGSELLFNNSDEIET